MKRFGLIGYPLGHSFSRNYFNHKFAIEKIDAEYVNFEIPSIHDFKKIVDEDPNIYGLNVTIPYKQQIIPFLDELDSAAEEIGAVNVIKFVRESDKNVKLVGYNSDVIGFMQSIKPMIKSYHKKALILGTGGASKAVIYGLKKLGVDSVFVSRTKKEGLLIYDELTSEVMHTHTVIVNCSPVGMFPKTDACPAIPYEYVTDKHLLFDLVYNPEETLFMKKGMQQGATTKNGLEMLHLQAIGAWNIWNK